MKKYNKSFEKFIFKYIYLKFFFISHQFLNKINKLLIK